MEENAFHAFPAELFDIRSGEVLQKGYAGIAAHPTVKTKVEGYGVLSISTLARAMIKRHLDQYVGDDSYPEQFEFFFNFADPQISWIRGEGRGVRSTGGLEAEAQQKFLLYAQEEKEDYFNLRAKLAQYTDLSNVRQLRP